LFTHETRAQPLHGWHEQTEQHGDDGDYHQQLDQCHGRSRCPDGVVQA
jgi:hypothetical protein